MNKYKHLEEPEVFDLAEAEGYLARQREAMFPDGMETELYSALRNGIGKPSGEAISGALRRAKQTFTDTRSRPCAPNLDPDAEAAKDVTTSKPVSAFDRQVGGSHYKDYKIQTWDLVRANNLDYWQGTIIKYLMRWRQKGGVQDLEKAKHTLDAYIEVVRDADPC